MKITNEQFDLIYKRILRNVIRLDSEYAVYKGQKYPFQFTDGQINRIINIPSEKQFKSVKDLGSSEYDSYFTTCNVILSVNNFENFTIERYIKMLEYYVEARKANLIEPGRQEVHDQLFPETNNGEAVFYLLILKKLSKDELAILEKFIEDNLDCFLDYFLYYNYAQDGLTYPMEYLRFFSETLQEQVNFSVEFLDKYYMYFNCFELYYNSRVMKDMDKQKLVFGKIKEHTLNSIATILTSGKIHPNFKVEEEDVLASIFRYNT